MFFFFLLILRNPDTKFEELELFGVTSLVEHPAQMSPPGKSIGVKMCKLKIKDFVLQNHY